MNAIRFYARKMMTEALFFVKRKLEENKKKRNLYMCLVDIEKTFVRVLKVMEWAMRKKDLP